MNTGNPVKSMLTLHYSKNFLLQKPHILEGRPDLVATTPPQDFVLNGLKKPEINGNKRNGWLIFKQILSTLLSIN